MKVVRLPIYGDTLVAYEWLFAEHCQNLDQDRNIHFSLMLHCVRLLFMAASSLSLAQQLLVAKEYGKLPMIVGQPHVVSYMVFNTGNLYDAFLPTFPYNQTISEVEDVEIVDKNLESSPQRLFVVERGLPAKLGKIKPYPSTATIIIHLSLPLL